MDPSSFDELEFFKAIRISGARARRIGRRALVLLGLPVLTADYAFWIANDDIARLNAACEPFGLIRYPTGVERLACVRLAYARGRRNLAAKP